jgi:exopolyphosphatase/guanosine-5'-triphosphate,3'-diphosphate pyrophosphatase
VRLAAIDIGTNASRLLISEVTVNGNGIAGFNKLNLIRVPLRLGFDVFETGEISKEKKHMILQTMKAYAHLMNAYGVDKSIAVATSAMRDARNRDEVVRKIFLETGINIKVISGDFEASLIYESHVAENLNANNNYLYVDVGGGSTELTFFSNNALVYKHSFNIGTIRLLKNMVKDADWQEMKDALREFTRSKKYDCHRNRRQYQQDIFSQQEKRWQAPAHRCAQRLLQRIFILHSRRQDTPLQPQVRQG